MLKGSKNRPIQLGKVDRETFEKVKQRLLKGFNWRSFGVSYLEDYEKGRDLRARAFGYLNALGYEYGYALARAYLEGFLEAQDPDTAAREAEKAGELIYAHIRDISDRVKSIDVAYARQAIEEVGDRLPSLENPEELLAFAAEHDGGLYIKDFSYSVWEALQMARLAVMDFLVWHGVPYAVAFSEEKGYVPEIFENPSRDELKRAVKLANEEIRKRTYYGHYTVRLPEHPNFSILSWANGSESWHLMWGPTQAEMRRVALGRGGDVSLDANYILIPVHPSVMEQVLPELDPLPLFEYSFEAKIRGKYPHADDRTVRRVLRAMIDAEMPGEDVEERAVMAIELWDTFVKAKQGNLAAQRAVEQFFLALEKPVVAYTKILGDWLDE